MSIVCNNDLAAYYSLSMLSKPEQEVWVLPNTGRLDQIVNQVFVDNNVVKIDDISSITVESLVSLKPRIVIMEQV